MSKRKLPVTPAIRVLRQCGIEFEPHLYDYEDKGGTRASSRALGVPEHAVIKTLIMEDDRKSPLVVLMHGDAEVSTKTLARHLGAKSIVPCDPDVAQKHSGYQVGGTSPFGTRKAMPVYVERTILLLDTIYVNGGKRGFLVSLSPDVLRTVVAAQPVDVRA